MYQETAIVLWISLNLLGFSDYEASNTGFIRNKKSGKTLFGSVRKTSGYRVVSLIHDTGKSKTRGVHTLVASAHLGIPTDKTLTPDHKDRNKLNNHVDNLQWATKSDQIKNQKKSKPKSKGKAITQIQEDGLELFTWFKGTDAAKAYKLDPSALVRAITSGRLYGGFRWKYARENIEGEIWQSVPGDFAYLVYASNMGRIALSSGKISFGKLSEAGYKSVNIKSSSGKGVYYQVHILVALAFYGPSDLLVNHEDGRKNNNKLSNLKYVTHADNMKHAWETGLMVIKKNNPSVSKKVRQFNLNGVFLQEFPSMAEAERQTNVKAKRIGDYASGRRTSNHEFHWEFA